MTVCSEWSVLLRAWAEEVQRLISDFRAVRDEHRQLIRLEEREGAWAVSDEDIVQLFRRHWIACQKVVWAAYQFNRWRVRHARSRQQPPPVIDANLKNLRDALEHLDEAEWVDDTGFGPPGKKGNAGRGLRALPGGGLMFALGFDERIMDLVDVEALSKEVNAVIAALDREEDDGWEPDPEHLQEVGYFDQFEDD